MSEHGSSPPPITATRARRTNTTFNPLWASQLSVTTGKQLRCFAARESGVEGGFAANAQSQVGGCPPLNGREAAAPAANAFAPTSAQKTAAAWGCSGGPKFSRWSQSIPSDRLRDSRSNEPIRPDDDGGQRGLRDPEGPRRLARAQRSIRCGTRPAMCRHCRPCLGNRR